MIVDLRLGSRKALVVGGGREATKRVAALAKEGCAVTVVSPDISDAITEMAGRGRVAVVREAADISILERMGPDLVVAATDDHPLNRALMAEARRRRMLRYSSSDPPCSDYAHLAQAEFGGLVRIAVSTGGRSPAAAMRIRDIVRGVLDDAITPQMLQDIETSGSERTAKAEAAR